MLSSFHLLHSWERWKCWLWRFRSKIKDNALHHQHLYKHRPGRNICDMTRISFLNINNGDAAEFPWGCFLQLSQIERLPVLGCQTHPLSLELCLMQTIILHRKPLLPTLTFTHPGLLSLNMLSSRKLHFIMCRWCVDVVCPLISVSWVSANPCLLSIFHETSPTVNRGENKCRKFQHKAGTDHLNKAT